MPSPWRGLLGCAYGRHLQDGRPRAVDDEARRLGSGRVRGRGRGRFRGRFRVRGRVRMMKQAALGPL